MSKDLFLMMREQEIVTSNFLPTKKEIEFSSKKFASDLLDSGDYNQMEIFAQAERMATAVNAIRDEIKASLPREKQSAFGVEITPVNGRQMIQFAEDDVYAELQSKLKAREELLKTALKINEPFYDAEGVEVPKVSVKYAADSFTVKY